jgi:hypothetical protein
LSRWYAHIGFFADKERNNWPGVKAAAPAAATPAKKEEKKEEKKDEDDIDLFGEEDEDDAREREIMRIAAEQEAKKKASGKVVIAKSAVIIDVKPWDDTTDMKAIEESVRSIKMDGLEWKGKHDCERVDFPVLILFPFLSHTNSRRTQADRLWHQEARHLVPYCRRFGFGRRHLRSDSGIRGPRPVYRYRRFHQALDL